MALIRCSSKTNCTEQKDIAVVDDSDVSDNEDASSPMETDSSTSEEETDDSESVDDSLSQGKDAKQLQESPKELFKLNCMHSLDSSSRQKCFESWFAANSNLSNVSKLHIKEYSGKSLDKGFTPWWEVIAGKKGKQLVGKSSLTNKDDSLYGNWFNKSSGADGSTWLSGPSTSKRTLVSDTVVNSEDVNVPSIYDKNPKPQGRRAKKRERKAEREKTTGKKWFDMQKPDVDEKIKMDMEIIQMRSVLDPKRFYKHNDRKGLPKFFQMGTVVDEGTDFYSSRLTKKQRKQTLVEELMADANIRQYNKKKYGELQQKHRGRKFKSKAK